MNQASAFIFCSGNVIYFDENGEQIVDLQRLGLSGLHQFVERYPDVPVYWVIWHYKNTGKMVADRIDPVSLRNLLRYIRRRPSPRGHVSLTTAANT